jgi:hypothetical protein
MTVEVDRTRLIEVIQRFNFFGLSHFMKESCKERFSRVSGDCDEKKNDSLISVLTKSNVARNVEI